MIALDLNCPFLFILIIVNQRAVLKKKMKMQIEWFIFLSVYLFMSLFMSVCSSHFTYFLFFKKDFNYLSFSLYLGNPMDPPDVLGIDSGIARPTKLPNRAKSNLIQTFLQHLHVLLA